MAEPLPDGYTLDEAPPLPEGFRIDSPEEQSSFLSRLGRQTALAGRSVVEGAASLPGLAFDPLVAVPLNAAADVAGIPEQYRIPSTVSAASSLMTQAGVPEPENSVERSANTTGQIGTGMFLGGGATRAVMQRLGLLPQQSVTTSAPGVRETLGGARTTPADRLTIGDTNLPPNIRAVAERGAAARAAMSADDSGTVVDDLGYPVESAPHDEAVEILTRNGVSLSRAQRSGNMGLRMIESGTSRHPWTAQPKVDFVERQMGEFTRAALRRIGVNSRRATPEVMNRAARDIGSVFDDTAKAGVEIADDTARRVVDMLSQAKTELKPSEYKLLWDNMTRLSNAIDDGGRINGSVYNSVRRSLRGISRRPEVGSHASDLDELLLDALLQSNPRQAQALELARSQWRNLKVIEGAIDKGLSGTISPTRLANAWSTMRNRAASIYGRGGDQELIQLARAGKDLIPDVLPSSGTAERSLMQMPIRAVATAPIYGRAHAFNISQPGTTITQTGSIPSSVVGGAVPATNALTNRR